MDSRNFPPTFLQELQRTMSKKSIETKGIPQQQALPPTCPTDVPPVCPVDVQPICPSDLPPICPVETLLTCPSDLPPPCPDVPTDLEMFGVEGCAILLRLEKRLQEFLATGEMLSEKASKVPEALGEKLSNLGRDKVLLLPDDGLTLTMFIQRVIHSVTILSQLNNPFPQVSAAINDKSSSRFFVILFAMNTIRENIINPAFNNAFKLRAIQCVQLTLAYEKIRNSPLDIIDIQNELILPFQRLTRLGLFVIDALKDFNLLKDCEEINDANKQAIFDTINHLQELLCRSQLIGIAVNEMKAAIDVLAAFNPQYKRYSLDSIKMLEFTQLFVEGMVEHIMQGKIRDAEIFSKQTHERIKHEFTMPLHLIFITPSERMYHDVIILLSNSKSNRKDAIKNLVGALSLIHENPSLEENDKLLTMAKIIKTTYNALAAMLNRGSLFSWKSGLADDLHGFINNELIKYGVLPSNPNIDETLSRSLQRRNSNS